MPYGTSAKSFWKFCKPFSSNKTTNFDDQYENQSSVIKIKSSVKTIQLFDFNFVNSDDILKIINSLDPTKSGAISTKIVKLANKQICQDLLNSINEFIKQSKFPNELKIADITPMFIKEDPLDKTNYRPISMLPDVSKILEEIFNQSQRF